MLHEISFELDLVKDHLDFIEKQIDSFRKSQPEPDYDEQSEYFFRVDCLPTRLYRGPFVLMVYAVFEFSVKEIAKILKSRKETAISIDDLKQVETLLNNRPRKILNF